MVVSHLRQGKNVRLDGLGTFSLALSSREVTDRKEIRAASVRIKKVNFRPVPELVKRVRQDTDILRAEFGFLPTGKKYTKEERWKLLEAYLKEHGSITRLAYSEWLGVGAHYGGLRAEVGMRRRDWTKKESILMRCMCCASRKV